MLTRPITNVGEAYLFLLCEVEFMKVLGIDENLLDTRWAERMLLIKWPALTQQGVVELIQEIGWF